MANKCKDWLGFPKKITISGVVQTIKSTIANLTGDDTIKLDDGDAYTTIKSNSVQLGRSTTEQNIKFGLDKIVRSNGIEIQYPTKSGRIDIASKSSIQYLTFNAGKRDVNMSELIGENIEYVESITGWANYNIFGFSVIDANPNNYTIRIECLSNRDLTDNVNILVRYKEV